MASGLQQISEVATFNGLLRRFKHKAESLGGLDAIFAAYVPNSVTQQGIKAPCLYFLSGLTCTDENFSIKCATGFEHASRAGAILILPDTSPRGAGVLGEDDSWDFGTGAGFYLNATQEPYAKHYNMYNYVTDELYDLVIKNFPVDAARISIMGHSMGGHGALTIGFKNPEKYRSISAFAPICNPSIGPWGIKALTNYLGDDKEAWKEYDAVEMLKRNTYDKPVLVDVGTKDNFEVGEVNQLQTKNLEELKDRCRPPMIINFQEGYDHSFYFISTFISSHIDFHMKHLQ